MAERPATLDPLYATTPAEQLAARQVHEPLVERLRAPYDRAGESPGLALTVRPSADATVWRATLRPGVRFHDGQPFNAAAVLANVDRWLAAPAGRGRWAATCSWTRRDPTRCASSCRLRDAAFDERLAAPELGVVSPAAIESAAGGPLDPRTEPDSGTGAFELREGSPGRVLLAHNTDWWGTDRGPRARGGPDRAAAGRPTRPTGSTCSPKGPSASPRSSRIRSRTFAPTRC